MNYVLEIRMPQGYLEHMDEKSLIEAHIELLKGPCACIDSREIYQPEKRHVVSIRVAYPLTQDDFYVHLYGFATLTDSEKSTETLPLNSALIALLLKSQDTTPFAIYSVSKV